VPATAAVIGANFAAWPRTTTGAVKRSAPFGSASCAICGEPDDPGAGAMVHATLPPASMPNSTVPFPVPATSIVRGTVCLTVSL
jgi:hypothetical protein